MEKKFILHASKLGFFFVFRDILQSNLFSSHLSSSSFCLAKKKIVTKWFIIHKIL